ncbi:organic solvent tolerance protein OstA [Zhouia amylolytica AD3]|uniref:Organic solvent tolerance protein OstA n=1 Tax=Zhouia amylolytica AD3 TaxID=1286632 RepID=W2UPI0_9FLAO|nr:organic solvent tolerance protein OstA [Zhouia amylolytica AD3]
MSKIFNFIKNFKVLRFILNTCCYILVLLSFYSNAQEPQGKRIKIVYGGDFSKDEAKYPGAAIFSKAGDRQVQFEHEGVDFWCDVAVYYQEDNTIKAYGDVFFQQGDSIKMNSDRTEYNGNTKIAVAEGAVNLRNNSMELTSEKVWFDRTIQEAYYNTFGTVKDSVNTLTSNKGRYYLTIKKYEFKSDVKIVNPDYNIESARLDYYTNSRNAYMYGPSTITGKDYKLYCERGFYDTKVENGYGIKNTRIDYNNRIIRGDSVYFDKAREFASATNNIRVIDTINKGVVKGHYAEVYKAKDSLFVTKRAVAISIVEKDSMYIHGDTLMVTGKENERIIKAFHNAKFFKSDMSGKCDSITSDEKSGITRLIKDPILWSGKTQMTGDSILITSDLETEKLDSLKVLNNAFIVQKDTLSENAFNQIKGKDLFGKFIDNKLKQVDVVKNAELIYYLWNETEFIGIDKRKCGSIEFIFSENEIDDVISRNEVDGNIYPDKELPPNGRKLRGLKWYGDQMILTKDDIFDKDDNNIILPEIKGVTNPIDIDNPNLAPGEEKIDEKSDEENDPSKQNPTNVQPKPKATPAKKQDTIVVKKSSKTN